MHCTKKITDDLTWVGANDRRLMMFEGVYAVPDGVSYNSYLLTDEKTVLFDTADKAVKRRFLENVSHALAGRPLDYLVVQHMEPDHSDALAELMALYPGMTLVVNEKTLAFIEQFYNADVSARARVVRENDALVTGSHTLRFFMAPMVHWPEVMVTYDETDKTLFSADAFGCFGATNGAIFADEVDFEKDFLDEARRYYTNICGKYGTQVTALLKKASALAVDMICPLHGFVWREKLNTIISKYMLWGGYEPEERGVMIAYASVYGNTENAAEILACRLRDSGIKTAMYDVSVTPASTVVAAAFRWSHLVFASTTYNAGIFVTMDALLTDLAAHNIQNRTVAIIENGSWAASSGQLMREILDKCKNITFLEKTVSLRSGVAPSRLNELNEMADAIINTFSVSAPKGGANAPAAPAAVDPKAFFALSYGLFVLTAKDGDTDGGCIINTVTQVASNPVRISISVNKSNYTHDMIMKTKAFAVSVLTESVPFKIFEQFGFKSGRDTDKFAGCGYSDRAANGIRYVPVYTNAAFTADVIETFDCGSHTLFIADVTQAVTLSGEPSVTYAYYFEHIKPKPAPPAADKKGFICKICGYVYEGSSLPDDYVCPLCKHGAGDFEPL